MPDNSVKTMRAWLFDAVDQPLRSAVVDRPTPGPGEVLVSVRASGLCHSDVGFMDGTLTHILPGLPMILGHEAAGDIVEIGPGVSGWEVGDRVVSAISSDDSPGVTRDGAYAEYMIVTATRLVRILDGISYEQAAAATDAGVTSYNGIVNSGGVRAGMTVGVIGLGGLGLTGARIGVIKGAKVIGIEPKRDVWDAARERGLTEIVADISELEGRELDLVVDYAGFSTTTAGALKAVRKGGRVVLVGLGKPEVTFAAHDLVSNYVTLVGSTPPGDPADVAAVLEMIASGDLVIAARTVGFDDIPEGLSELAAGRVSGRLVAALPAA
ncbi:alcohol dehydrogenase catalytic domain-containing protein [Nocardia alni]|uniref:alcohol dehydrogenase catalytic domain-containing protein n=1 Tax=Nocardia alni TaxID=2815723 RepID=UPI001C239495|nr:alcohol dehydrogenase catalytic domain-containing protein [Nocardia alni]